MKLNGQPPEITLEERLQQSEQRYRAFTELSSDFYFVCSRYGDDPYRIEWVGGQYERITGYCDTELFAMACWLPLVHPDDREQVAAGRSGLQHGDEVRREFRMIHKDQSVRWIQEHSRCMVDPLYPGFMRLYGTARDITDTRESAVALQYARDAAQAATVAKNEFLANMSHEVRTPLNGIMGLSQLLRTTELTGEQIEYMDMLDSSARNLLTLINDILDISRIEAGSLTIQKVPFSLGKLVQEVANIYEKPSEQKGLSLQLQTDDALPPIMMGDPLRLKQVLINLLGNAVKFTNQGVIHLRVGPPESGRVSFEVRDTGIGMSAETLQKLFNPFTQADASTTRLHGGSGLGLAICRRLTELMGGTIRVESQLGSGSSFYVEVPCCCSADELAGIIETPALPVSLPHPVGDLAILLVEDQEVNRTFVQRLLERQGYRIIPACDGLMALDLLNRGRYDLMLLDIQMPGMGGEEVLQRLRLQEQASGEHLPTIALTAHALAGDREKLIAIGFDGYISKPVQMDHLLAEMAWVLSVKGAVTE